MKHSIVKILKNLSVVLLLDTFLVFIVAAFVYEQNFSYKKIENLDEQRALINSLASMPKENIELAKIQINGKSSLLLAKISQLKRLYKYDFVGRYIIFSKQEYLRDLDELTKLTNELKKSAQNIAAGENAALQRAIEKINEPSEKPNQKMVKS